MKITNTSCLVIAILLSSINLFSQANKGIISGKVTNSSSSNNEEIIGAVVQIEGSASHPCIMKQNKSRFLS